MTNIPAVVNPRAPKRMVGCELLNLAAHNPADLVQLSEQQYQSRIDAAAAYVLASGRRIVMLTGPSAAGKTTSANKLAAAMRSKGVRSRVLSLDDFFVGEGRYPKQPDGRDDYECVEALDIPLVQHCLQQLAQTGVCDAPIFDFMTQLPAPQTQHIDCTDGVVVVEGLHAFNPILTETLPPPAMFALPAALRGTGGSAGMMPILPLACGPMSVRQRTSISRRSRIGRTLCWILHSAARWVFGNIILTS